MYVFFHCIIIEHIPECLVWWHSVPYLGYYFTLGHNPILRFIRCFADFSHCLFYFTLGHTPILGFIRPFAYFFTAWSISWFLWVLHWGIPPYFSSLDVLYIFLTAHSISWSLRVVTLGHTPFSAFLLGHTLSLWVYRVSCWFHGYRTHLLIFMSYYLRHPPTISLFRASPYCHLRLGHPPTVILGHLPLFQIYHHRRSSPMGLIV